MKKALKIVFGVLAVLVVLAGGTFLWASLKDKALLARTIDTHTVDFPIPFPLTEAEIAEVTAAATADGAAADGAADLDLDAIALERAVERGKHLVEARYGCVECHGRNFGGGVMVDDPMIGRLLGPNITAGPGGRTADFTAADWDHIVRHGVRADGHPAVMPSTDFQRMSDQELSDVVSFIRSQPEVDNTVPAPSLGPVGTLLVAFGAIPLSADLITDHRSAHLVEPPQTGATVEFGEHLASVCTGCHGPTFAGGPVPGGDPSWPPSANLTSHADGLAGWTYDQFATLMRTGKRPDGSAVVAPMSSMMTFAQQMTDVEMQALWMYLQSMPPVAYPR